MICRALNPGIKATLLPLMLYIYTVKCEVILLRRYGLRLRPEEWGDAVLGRLDMSNTRGFSGPLQTVMRRLELHINDSGPALCLFDPVFLDVLGDGFAVRGVELAPGGGRVYEHSQTWLIRPNPWGRPLARPDVSAWRERLPETPDGPMPEAPRGIHTAAN